GVGNGLTFCNAPVCNTWWNVQHVARLQYPFITALKMFEDIQRGIWHAFRPGITGLTDTPAAFTRPLQQEHIVLIKVRTDTALIRGITDHDVIQAPVRDKAEVLQKLMDF